MKTRGVWAMVALLLTTLAGGAVRAQDANFTLANNTSFTVYAVHYWPTDSSYRGPDRLGDATIASGESFSFEPRFPDCVYNLRITLVEANYEKEWRGVDLCGLDTVTLQYDYKAHVLSALRN